MNEILNRCFFLWFLFRDGFPIFNNYFDDLPSAKNFFLFCENF